MTLERATLDLLESINEKYVCVNCRNQGGGGEYKGEHVNGCVFMAVLNAWRDKFGVKHA